VGTALVPAVPPVFMLATLLVKDPKKNEAIIKTTINALLVDLISSISE